MIRGREDPEKRFRTGGERVCDPAETVARVRPLLQAMGITRIADISGLDHIGIPVVSAIRPNARSLAVSQGKGLSIAAATASAVMEAIELFHAERVQLPLVLATASEMHGTRNIVDLPALAGARNSRFHPDLPMLWVEGQDLLGGAAAWLPFEVVHMNACLPVPPGSGCWQATSNGLASGNTRQEAILHALCEVIERDAAAVWQVRSEQHRLSTKLDLDTVDDEHCRSVLARFVRAEVGVDAWDITSEAGVPSFLCEISEPLDAEHESRFSGMGTHLRREIALLRALTEAAQSRLTYISGSRDDIFSEDFRRVRRARRPTQAPSELRSFRDIATAPANASFGDDEAALFTALRALDVSSVFVVDLTDPRWQIPVVRVVAPGLEGPDDDPSYLPGQRARRAAEMP